MKKHRPNKAKDYSPLTVVSMDGKVFTDQTPGKPKGLLMFASVDLARAYAEASALEGIFRGANLDDRILAGAVAAGCKRIAYIINGVDPSFEFPLDRDALRKLSDQLKKDPTLSEFDPIKWPSAN